MTKQHFLLAALVTILAVQVKAATYTTSTPVDNQLTLMRTILAVQASPDPAPYATNDALLAAMCGDGYNTKKAILQDQLRQVTNARCQSATQTQKNAACAAVNLPNNCGLCN